METKTQQSKTIRDIIKAMPVGKCRAVTVCLKKDRKSITSPSTLRNQKKKNKLYDLGGLADAGPGKRRGSQTQLFLAWEVTCDDEGHCPGRSWAPARQSPGSGVTITLWDLLGKFVFSIPNFPGCGPRVLPPRGEHFHRGTPRESH